MDQLPVGGRYVPSQARKKYVTEVIFVIPAATEQSMFSLYLWAGLGCEVWQIKLEQFTADYPAQPSPATATSHQPTQSRIKSFGSFRCGTELCSAALHQQSGEAAAADQLHILLYSYHHHP